MLRYSLAEAINGKIRGKVKRTSFGFYFPFCLSVIIFSDSYFVSNFAGLVYCKQKMAKEKVSRPATSCQII